MNIEQRRQDLELLQNLITSTTRHHVTGPIAVEVNNMKKLVRWARDTGGMDGVLAVVRLFRSSIEVCQPVLVDYYT